MARIFIDGQTDTINEIAWQSDDGKTDYIELGNNGNISLNTCNDENAIELCTEDISKLIQALEKAKELGWWE